MSLVGFGTPFEHYGAGRRPDWRAPLFERNPLYPQLFERVFKHPFLGRLIEWAPLDWLLPLSNPTPSRKTDLGRGQTPRSLSADPEVLETVNLDELWKSLCEDGMRDPLILTVGRMDRRIRLEAGNHRLRLFSKYKIQHIPLVAYVGDYCQISLKNGKHPGREVLLKIPHAPDIMAPYSIFEYHKPSAIVREFKPLLNN